MKIIIFQSNIIKIGGVETFTFNMCKQLSKHYDVQLLYKQCDLGQLKRLRRFVKCEVYNPATEYECDICLLASSWGGYPESVKSTKGEYWQMIHANYKELAKTGYKYTKWERTTRHFAVSNTVRDIFNEMYKEKATTMYNLLDDIQATQPILKLISATRLSGEKGYNRMIQLAHTLKNKNVNFRWLIFTDLKQYSIKPIQMEEIIYMEPRYDLFDYIKEADYGVQLSDTEGYSYFVNECLQYGVPMITTNFDSVFESVEDGVNGYILDMDLSNLDIDKIFNHRLKGFKYEPKTKTEDWIKIIGKPSKEENYVYKQVGYETEVIIPCYYSDEEKQCAKGDYLLVETKERLEKLVKGGYVKELKG